MKNEKQPIGSTPRHSAAVERVAREIMIWSVIAAAVCTLIVMVIP